MALRHFWRSLQARLTLRSIAGRSGSRRPITRKPHLEALEDRSIPAVGFGSALGVGNDTGASNASNVVTDAAGNSYMTGSFSGTADFDPNNTHPGDTDILASRGPKDAFVAKYAPDSSIVWALRMGGDQDDGGADIAIDGSGNVYVAGDFFGSADFGSKTLVSTDGDSDGFVAKLNSSGSVQWANAWGPTGGVGSVGVDGNGNVYALKIKNWPQDFEVRKFRWNGGTVWTQSVDTNGAFGASLAVDASGNVFVGGDFHGTVDFDPSSKSKYVVAPPTYNGFVLKLTTAGKFSWVSPFIVQGGPPWNICHVTSIALDSSGNVIVGGGNSGTVDFDPGAGTTYLPGRGFITKLDSNGGLAWAKALESDDTIFVHGLSLTADGSTYATGSFYGTVDFDPGTGTASRTTAGGSDVFVIKLDSSGNFGWAESFGAAGNDIGWGIAVDAAGIVHLAGRYQGAVDFDPDPIDEYWLTNPGSYSNMFLVRLTQP